jgi:hypothetical protein
MSSIGAIVADKEVFLRERAAAMYDTEPYFASKILCDLLPLRLLPPVAFTLIVYPMCSLHSGRMEIFLSALLLLNATAAAMCFFAAAVANSVGTANLWASLFFIYVRQFISPPPPLCSFWETGSRQQSSSEVLHFVFLQNSHQNSDLTLTFPHPSCRTSCLAGCC